jgi:hypothetical protein
MELYKPAGIKPEALRFCCNALTNCMSYRVQLTTIDHKFLYKATDTLAILFWRWQCNGGKIVALPSRERNCLCIMLCDGNAKLRTIVAEISNNLIFGNDCRKLGGVVKEGQG